MGTWLNAYLFPSRGLPLNTKNISELFEETNLKQHDLDFYSELLFYEMFEDIYFANVMPLNKNESETYASVISGFIDKHIDFQAAFNSQLIYGSICTQLYAPIPDWNAHISINWPFSLYHQNIQSQASLNSEYCKIFQRVCETLQASYVLFTSEASETFTDCFIEIDGARYFDAPLLLRTDPWPMTIFEVWVNHGQGVDIPVGFPVHPAQEIGNGFVKYHLNYTAMKDSRSCIFCNSKL